MSEPRPNLDSLFDAALEIESAEERAAFVADACGDDAELRRQLENLLRSSEAAGSFLEQPPAEFGATVLTGPEAGDRGAALDAGLAATSEREEAVVVGKAGHSVLRVLGQTIDMPRVALRESQVEGDDPITRPNSLEMPERDSDSRYRMDGEIARGGMGAIIKGRDTDLGRDLAIKVLLDSHKDKPEVIQRFVEEAQIGGQLQHPGIAPIYELGQFSDRRPFFAMKLVKGQTLSRLLGDREDANEERGRFIGIFEQVCQTMGYAHSRGVIHRDHKPANIMVGAFGEVQVMDWGLAKVLSAGGIEDEKQAHSKHKDHSIIQTMRSVGSDTPGEFGSVGSETQMGSVMGTPAYMPPEQALGEIDNMDERADVFGLGAILCEILTGKPPYVAEDGTQVYRMASRGKLKDAFERLEDCGADADLIQLTKSCLELEPADRPRDAGVLAERVTGYLESVEEKLREAEVKRAAEAARADAEEAQAAAERQRAEAQAARAEAESARASAESKRRRTSLALGASVMLLVSLCGSGWTYMERQEAAAQREHAAEMVLLAEQRDGQRKAAEAARELAQRNEAAAQKALARSALSLAEAAMREEDGPAMQAALNDVPEKLRDSTWSYLQSQSDSSIAHINPDGLPLEAVAADPSRPGVFALIDSAGLVTVQHIPTGERLTEFQPAFASPQASDRDCLAYSADGQQLAVGRRQAGGVVVCQPSSGRVIKEFEMPHPEFVEFDDGNQLLCWGRGDGNVSSLHIWDITTKELLWEQHAGTGNIGIKATFIPGRKEVLVYTGQKRLQVVNATDGKLVRNLGGRGSSYKWSMTVHPDGRKAFTCNASQVTECVSLEDGRVLFTLPDRKRRFRMTLTAR